MAKGQLDVLESLIRKELEAYLRENKIKFKRLNELESTTNAADDQKVAALKQKKADLDKKAAQNDAEIAKLKQQIDAIEKK
jgi:predicted nuclease with TOPRIM domain